MTVLITHSQRLKCPLKVVRDFHLIYIVDMFVVWWHRQPRHVGISTLPEIKLALLRAYTDRDVQGDIQGAWVSSTLSPRGGYFSNLPEVNKQPHYYPEPAKFMSCSMGDYPLAELELTWTRRMPYGRRAEW